MDDDSEPRLDKPVTRDFRDSAEKARLLARIRALQDRLASLPILDDRMPDEIIGYDENELFGS